MNRGGGGCTEECNNIISVGRNSKEKLQGGKVQEGMMEEEIGRKGCVLCGWRNRGRETKQRGRWKGKGGEGKACRKDRGS